ncbi:MAG TPA: hypothetical protein VK158_05280 [Acidobacteriota bacterium]|nr:hypothetical protein [Acidobacteriota bacterium]
MKNLIPLKSKEVKLLREMIFSMYGYEPALECAVFLHEFENKLYLLDRSFIDLDLNAFRVNSLGSYFAEYNDDKTNLRLSIEGSQMIGPHATKNVLTLSDDAFFLWSKGQNIPMTSIGADITTFSGYVIIKNSLGDFFGVGRIKNDELLNFTPKIRRVAIDADAQKEFD